jgi:HK97 family phage prohead protease
MPEQITRGFIDGCEVRSIDEDARTATFVAATENGVDTYVGREHIKMSGMKLDRYRRNPVILDTHDRYSAGAVIGKAVVKVVNRQLEAVVTFAETPRAEEVWQLVKGGFLRALSVGFMPGETQRLAEGEKTKLGDRQIDGPAIIRKTSELYEISVVPVPADADALRRGMGLPEAMEMLLEKYAMAKTKEQESAPVVPAETAETKAPEASATTELRSAVIGPPTEVEVASRNEVARREAIMGLTCGDKMLEPVARRCILEGKTIEEARKELLADYTKRSAPVGTPEPTKVEKTEEKRGDEDGVKIADIPNEVFSRGLFG